MGPIHPNEEQLTAIAHDKRDTPIIMVNLLRYRDRAAYSDERPDGDVSGREAYGRYAAAVMAFLEKAGGRILWGAPCEQTVIGGPDERWDDIVAVWYPNRQAFVKMATDPEYLAISVHRDAALERGSLYACAGSAEPTLEMGNLNLGN